MHFAWVTAIRSTTLRTDRTSAFPPECTMNESTTARTVKRHYSLLNLRTRGIITLYWIYGDMLTVWRCHAPKRAFFCFEPAVRSTIIDGDATRPETSAHDSDNATKHLNAQCETNGTNKSQEGRKLARRDLETQLVTPPPSSAPTGKRK